MLDKLSDKFLYNGYKAASRQAVRDVVARYSRGNVSIQAGRYVTRDDLEILHEEANRAAKRLEARLERILR